MITITEEKLTGLREQIRGTMSPKRFHHTEEVEKMAAYLGGLYAPEKVPMLRAAALLHDITKEYTTDRQLWICAQKGVEISAEEGYAPKTFHARTAAALIPELYPDFNDPEIIGCVRWHTTGRRDMTLCEQLVYLADYIDMSRTFDDCVKLRQFFMEANPEKMSREERLDHLRDTLILSFDMTVRGLLEEGLPVSTDSMEARNQLVCRRLALKQ